MSRYYYAVKSDLSTVIDAIDYFEREFDKAKMELSLKGKPVEKHSAELPGVFETRFTQLQEIEAILEYLNIELRKKRSQAFRKYLENYNRALSSRDCEKYVDGDADVVDLTMLVNEFALVRNKYLGIIKGLDNKSYQLNNLIKLKASGFDDFEIR